MTFKLLMTCFACPEQYDVYDGTGKRVAYFRLRHGRFTASTPDAGGELVYEAHTKGDGMFDEEERRQHLEAALDEVAKSYGSKRTNYIIEGIEE